MKGKDIPSCNRCDLKVASLNSTKNKPHYIDLITALNCNEVDINHATNKLYKYLSAATAGIFKTKVFNSCKSFPTNALFDQECKDLKSRLNQKLKQNYNQIEINDLMKQYKQTVQRKKRNYFKYQAENIMYLNKTDQINFWKYWNMIKMKITQAQISTQRLPLVITWKTPPTHLKTLTLK